MERRDFLKKVSKGIIILPLTKFVPVSEVAAVPVKEKSYHNGIYMLRNLMVGDEEQTRIADGYIEEDLPPDVANVVQYVLSVHDDYDKACELYIRHMLKDLTHGQFKVEVEKFLVDWNDYGAEEGEVDDLRTELMSGWKVVMEGYAYGR